MPTITERVLAAQNAQERLQDVVDAVAEMVYRYPAGKPGFTEEDGAEFLVRFYPRIKRLVRRYRPSGTTFDAYLNASLRWQLRSLAAERSGARVRLVAASEAGTSTDVFGREGMVAEPPAEIRASSPSEAPSPSPLLPRVVAPTIRSARGSGRSPTGRDDQEKLPAHRPSVLRLRPGGPVPDRLSAGQAQRLLCISLKACDRLDADLRARLARVTGCRPHWLEDRWQELRSFTESQRHRRETVRARRDQAWFRARCAEAAILNAVGNERNTLIAERARWSARYHRARSELLRMGDGPTHHEIARALGIAKGTVDSSIFKARHELRDAGYRDRLARLFDAP